MCPEMCEFCNEIVLAVTLAVVSGRSLFWFWIEIFEV